MFDEPRDLFWVSLIFGAVVGLVVGIIFTYAWLQTHGVSG